MSQNTVMKTGFFLMFVLFGFMLFEGVTKHNEVITTVSFVGLFGTGILAGQWFLYRLVLGVGIEAMEVKHRLQGLAWYMAMRDDHPRELQIYKDRYGSVVCGCPNCQEKQKEIENIVTGNHMIEQVWGEDNAGKDSV